jgi:hypothetical protein
MKYLCRKVVMHTKSVSFEQKVKYLFGERGFGIAFEAHHIGKYDERYSETKWERILFIKST